MVPMTIDHMATHHDILISTFLTEAAMVSFIRS